MARKVGEVEGKLGTALNRMGASYSSEMSSGRAPMATMVAAAMGKEWLGFGGRLLGGLSRGRKNGGTSGISRGWGGEKPVPDGNGARPPLLPQPASREATGGRRRAPTGGIHA